MYLLFQIWWSLLLAFLLGALVGYLLWRTCRQPMLESRFERSRLDMASRLSLLEEERANFSSEGRNAGAEAAAAEAERRHGEDIAKLKSEHAAALARFAEEHANAKNAAPAQPSKPLADVSAGQKVGDKPKDILAAPRGGAADDLKLIWGVGPKLEALLNKAGFYHFDQIAKWTDREIEWVDTQLGDFAGRAVRDKWIEQCKKLASGWRPASDVGERPR